MTYKITFTKSAAKELRKLDRPMQKRIEGMVELLATDPRPPACKAVKSRPGTLRVRTGDYRVIYEVHDDRLVVLVVRLGHRSSVY